MRITESRLRKIVREELEALDPESTGVDPEEVGEYGPVDADPAMGRSPSQYSADRLERDAEFPGAAAHAMDALEREFGMGSEEAEAVVNAVLKAMGR